MLEILLSLLILIGAGFTLVGSLGLLRLRDFYSRLHAPTKASTLGVGSLLIASALFFSYQDEGLSLHEVLVTLFLFITAPVGAHLMAKAALHLRLQSLAETPPDGMLDGASCAEHDVTGASAGGRSGSDPASR
jgi:multicomponent K+:H+ antiporter subunit G